MVAKTRAENLRVVSDGLAALRRLERHSSSERRPGCGVTASQGMLVHEVALAGESGSTVSELATRLVISSSAVTQLIDGLVDAGILSRTSDPHDQRRTRITLTAHGETLYSLFDQARLSQAEALFQELDDAEVRVLAKLLSKATGERWEPHRTQR